MRADAEKKKDKINYGESKALRFGPLILLLLMFILNCIFTRNFFSPNTVWILFIQACPIIITGLGMTFVISSGGIDISVGATMALAGTIMAKMMIQFQMPLITSILVALLVGTVIGLVNGIVIAKFKVQPIIISLIMMLVARGVAQVVNDGAPIPFSRTPLNEMVSFRFWPQGMPMQLVLCAILAIIIVFVMKYTVFGKYVQSIGDNNEASRLAGINTFILIVLVYAICGFLAGLAGIIEVGRESQAEPAKMGLNVEMSAIAAVAIGGTPMSGGRAHVWGTIIGALIMQLVGMTVNMNGLLSSWGMVFKAVILILAVYSQRRLV